MRMGGPTTPIRRRSQKQKNDKGKKTKAQKRGTGFGGALGLGGTCHRKGLEEISQRQVNRWENDETSEQQGPHRRKGGGSPKSKNW